MHHNLHVSEFSFLRLYSFIIKLQISSNADLTKNIYDSNDSNKQNHQ